MRWSRRRLIVVLSAVLLLATGAALVGGVIALTRTTGGLALLRRVLLPVAQAAIPGKLYVGTIGGTLYGDLTIDSLDIRSADGRPFLSTGPIRIQWDPRDLLDARVVITSLEVTRPTVTLVDYGNDDWNWKRALMRRRASTGGPRGRFGRYIVIDTTTLRELTFVARLPWTLPDSLKGAKRDSALTFNLTRRDGEVRAEDGRYVRVYRFVRGQLAMGRTRLADPAVPGQHFDVKRADVVWVYPPFWFRNLHGSFRRLGDSLFIDTTTFALPKARAAGRGKVVWGSGLPVRYDIGLRLDTIALSELAWIDETVPHVGGGSAWLRMVSDPRNPAIIDYRITGMDAQSLRSRITGNMTWGVGGFVTRLTDVDLDLQPAHTDLLRWFNGEPFPYDWRGRVTGRVRARGGYVTDWQLDRADVAFADEHVPGAVSRGQATGRIDLFAPAEAILKGVDLEIGYLDFRTPRHVNPLFAELNGFARGRVRLDSLWYDAWFSKADIELVDGPGQPSRFTGSGRYTLVPEGTIFDVDLQAVPLSYTTLSRSYPDMPLRGSAVGQIIAKGMADDMQVTGTLAGEGGELSFTGKADALEPVMGATGTWRMRGGNLQALFGDGRLPASTLNMRGTVGMYATTGPDGQFMNHTIHGPLRATVDEFSRLAEARVFSGTVVARFDSGVVHVDTLQVESSAARIVAEGRLGLDRAKRDTLRVTLAIDSLGGLRPWVAPEPSGPDAAPGLLLPSDSLRGMGEARLLLAGSIDTLDARGLDVDLRADLRDLVVAGTRSMRAGFEAQVTDVLRKANGRVLFTADSARVAGIGLATLTARSTLREGLAETFTLAARTPAEARIALGGGVTRREAATAIRIDSVRIRVDSGMTRPRGFALARPAVVALDGNGRIVLDSLVLQHTDTGRLTVTGMLGADGEVTGALVADRVPLEDFGRLAGTAQRGRGRMTLTGRIGGTRDAPEGTASIALAGAEWGRLRLGDFLGAARYADQRLAIEGALRVRDQPVLTAVATLPLDLALRARKTRTVEAPLTGTLRSTNTDLGVLTALFPDVTAARGSFDTDVRLTGGWDRPRLEGRLRVDSGSVSAAPLGIRLDQVSVDVGLRGDSIAVRRLRATSGLPGSRTPDTIGVSGLVAITEIANPFFDLTLAASSFLAIDKARTASIAISTPEPIRLQGTANAPVVRGALRLDRARVYINQLTQRRPLDVSTTDALIDTSSLDVNALLPSAPNRLMRNMQLDNVRLQAGDDVWLRSPEANLKLGGQLRVTRSAARDLRGPRLALADSLTVERGTYQLNLGIARPGFEVERGLVRFFGDPDLAPTLDITALHTVRETRANSNRQNVLVRVNVGGTVDRPTLALTSGDNPPLPESDLLSYLVTGEPAYALLGTPYAEQGATLALRLAGSYLSSRLAGGRFDVVQVEPTALNPGDAANLRQNGLGILASTRVGVGGQVAPNTYLTFSTGLCGLNPQANGGGDALSLFAQGLGVKVERRFDRGLSLAIGLEPASSAQACGRLGISRTFQQTPPQVGFDFFRFWTF